MAKSTARFIVEIDGTDVPPDWEGKTKDLLESEMRLRFGENVRVLDGSSGFVQGVLFE